MKVKMGWIMNDESADLIDELWASSFSTRVVVRTPPSTGSTATVLGVALPIGMASFFFTTESPFSGLVAEPRRKALETAIDIKLTKGNTAVCEAIKYREPNSKAPINQLTRDDVITLDVLTGKQITLVRSVFQSLAALCSTSSGTKIVEHFFGFAVENGKRVLVNDGDESRTYKLQPSARVHGHHEYSIDLASHADFKEFTYRRPNAGPNFVQELYASVPRSQMIPCFFATSFPHEMAHVYWKLKGPVALQAGFESLLAELSGSSIGNFLSQALNEFTYEALGNDTRFGSAATRVFRKNKRIADALSTVSKKKIEPGDIKVSGKDLSSVLAQIKEIHGQNYANATLIALEEFLVAASPAMEYTENHARKALGLPLRCRHQGIVVTDAACAEMTMKSVPSRSKTLPGPDSPYFMMSGKTGGGLDWLSAVPPSGRPNDNDL